MTARTFNDLQTESAEWLSREGDPFYASIFELLVQLTETRIRKLLRTRQMQTTAQISLTANSLTAPLPEDFAGVRGTASLVIESGRRNVDYISNAIPPRTQLFRDPGRPLFFYIYGSNIVTTPRPDINYVLEVPYLQQLLNLGTDRQTNWLIAKYPDVYFNGVMWYAYLYLQDFDRSGEWKDKFFMSLRDLRRIDKHDRFGVSGNRQRSPITPVDVPLNRAGRVFNG